MARKLRFLIVLLVLNAAAFGLGSVLSSRAPNANVLEDPRRFFMTLLDEALSTEQREWLAHHLPKLYKFEYACRLESVDGSDTDSLWVNQPAHTFTADLPILRCPRGIVASFAPGSRIALRRLTDGKITFELLSGSGFVTGHDTTGLSLSSGSAGFRITPIFPHFRLFVSATDSRIEVYALSGEFTLTPTLADEKALLFRSVQARARLPDGKAVHAGMELRVQNGESSTAEISGENVFATIAELQARIPNTGNVLPEMKALTASGGKRKYEVRVTLVNLEQSAQCKLELYSGNSANPTLEFPYPAATPTMIELPRQANFLAIHWCADRKTKIFTDPQLVYVQ